VKTQPDSATPDKTSWKVEFAEHIRSQFESLQRLTALAPDLTCYEPGQPLARLRFIAHAHGLHVARWLALLSHTSAKVEIDTANDVAAFANEIVSARPVLPRWLKLPMTVRYFLGGLVLRWKRKRSDQCLVHAHCASGNGLMAWLSGYRYVLGTYGSEIYDAHRRGSIYRWMLTQVLRRADRIQVGSTESVKLLQEKFGIPAERIYCLHLGLNEQYFHAVNDERRAELRSEVNLPTGEPIWIVNRRTDPHYRTLEVVQGFLNYCQLGGRGRLVLLCGDHQPDYTESVCQTIRAHADGQRVTVVDRMLTPKGMGTWLQLGDFSISVPKTDNFSVSTYESLGCGAVPIVANLEAYNQLRDCAAVHWMTDFEPSDFTKVFARTAATWPKPHHIHRKECLQFAKEGFSSENALRDLTAFYLGTPLRPERLARWAA